MPCISQAGCNNRCRAKREREIAKAIERKRRADLDKLVGLADTIYKELVNHKVDFPDSQIKAKLEVFSRLKEHHLKEHDKRRRGPAFFLPADQ